MILKLYNLDLRNDSIAQYYYIMINICNEDVVAKEKEMKSCMKSNVQKVCSMWHVTQLINGPIWYILTMAPPLYALLCKLTNLTVR